MRFLYITCIITIGLCEISPAAAIPLFDLNHQFTQQLTPREEARAILECLYRGQRDSALALAETFEAARPDDPLPLLIIARVMQETLSDQDDDKKRIEESAKPIVATLKRAISICDEHLNDSDADAQFYFYRGWGWIFKAQMDALSANYWSAGRSAKKGKNDLERFLSQKPGDPDASGILGTFLYFADTLPTVVKIIKSLFLIPGGDRERGLELLTYASNREGILTVDHAILLSAILTIFEGRFDDGIRSFSSLLQRYPAYLRLAEPLGVITPLRPAEIRSLQTLQTDVVTRHLDRNTGTIDTAAIHRITYHRSYAAMLFDPPEHSIEAFETLIAANPERPDWIAPLSMIDLGMLYANTADREKAREMFEAVIANDHMERFHDVAKKMLDSLDEGEGKLTGIYPRLVSTIYDGHYEESRKLFETFDSFAAGTVYSDFYRGDLELLTGNLREAERCYRRVLDRTTPAYAQIYQMLAASRLAELYGAQHEFGTAKELLKDALHYYHKEFLLDMLIEGRKRFYEARSERDSEPVPPASHPGAAPITSSERPRP